MSSSQIATIKLNIAQNSPIVTKPKFEPQPKITKIKNKSATLFIKLQNQKQL
jgi:hypothetical protein